MNFVLNAGQGEFTRLVVAPGDAEEAYRWSAAALNMAWKFQIPAIMLTDKTLCEGTYSFNIGCAEDIPREEPVLWDGEGRFKRYLNTETGVSPLAFPPDRRAVIKVGSYEHDEYGITTEDPRTTAMMQEKRLRKGRLLKEELRRYRVVGVSGASDSPTAILCWGSNKGVCVEASARFGARVVHVSVLAPFPLDQLRDALAGVTKILCVENNAAGQLARLAGCHGIRVDERILKYDGRQFSLDELEGELGKVI